MISFKQFLTEARMAPLYHGTFADAVENILIDGKGIKPKTLHMAHKTGLLANYVNQYGDKYVRGVSLTRNLHFADGWGSGWVLELDQRLLAQNYKILPYQYFQNSFPGARNTGTLTDKVGRMNESEEFVVTTKPIPPKYIKSLWVRKAYVLPGEGEDGKLFEPELIRKIRQKYGSSFIKTF